MWARVVEFMLGCWLACSPFIFKHSMEQFQMWAIDWIAAILVCTLALLSYWQPTRHAHVMTLLVACGLIGLGRFATGNAPAPAMENQIIIGLLLLMFAIVPNYASLPPEAWRDQASLPTEMSG